MKKLVMNFAEGLLSKEQMKKVRGGCSIGGSGSCYVSCPRTGYQYVPVGACATQDIWSVCQEGEPFNCYC